VISLRHGDSPQRAVVNRWVNQELGGDPDFLSVFVLFPSATFSTRLGALSFLKLISATIFILIQIPNQARWMVGWRVLELG
jgi:hypothetical protein